MPTYWTPAPYLRRASRLFAAVRCTMRRPEASPTSPRGSPNWRSAMASAFDPIRAGSTSLLDTSLSVIYIVGSTLAYGRIYIQNHRVETRVAGELLDGWTASRF